MLAKALTVSFALAAVWAQLALADEKREFRYTCKQFHIYLMNEKKPQHGNFVTKPAITINAIRNLKKKGCTAQIELVAVLNYECNISQVDEKLGTQIARYLMQCGKQWDQFLIPLRYAGGRSRLSDVFDEEYLEPFREIYQMNTLPFGYLPDNPQHMLMLKNIFRKYGDSMPILSYQVFEPCEEFSKNYAVPMVWIDRAITAADILLSLPAETQREYMQYKICEAILRRGWRFEKNLFSVYDANFAQRHAHQSQ